jgi:hypothetical protein
VAAEWSLPIEAQPGLGRHLDQFSTTMPIRVSWGLRFFLIISQGPDRKKKTREADRIIGTGIFSNCSPVSSYAQGSRRTEHEFRSTRLEFAEVVRERSRKSSIVKVTGDRQRGGLSRVWVGQYVRV